MTTVNCGGRRFPCLRMSSRSVTPRNRDAAFGPWSWVHARTGLGRTIAVHGELLNQAAIGVWYKPRPCFCHRYELRFARERRALHVDFGGREGIRPHDLLIANSGENKLRQGATIT